MPTAREALLAAAARAVSVQPWTGVRMVDVAAAAGVSRQTLYNEFGSKEGLGAALVERCVETFLDGAVRAAADAGRRGADPAGCCAASAAWMLRAARDEPVVHAALTGSWDSAMPVPGGGPAPGGGRSCREPGGLASVLRDRMIAGMGASGRPAAQPSRIPQQQRLGRACEVGLRMALSYVVAPVEAPDDETCAGIGDVVRSLLPER
ncbi:TetR/AcrR family transcriptional regulator [Streptomyces sp. HNM0574]|uniref:TetR/AcrR family transcriptional regulator n=1 Tax=Streptomyces sp. HNM0574 TaxID=2714954 RepID=UPI00146CE903|nr:TetR/AcrR family transcriptional regulator [Streptomyces sp. HNM0574]NLU67243.1 TetR/AcrR family transcriptional regulator [Streptomyces sp. HNM0574]